MASNFHLEHRYQDSGWEPLPGESYDDLELAFERASVLSQDSIAYGMVRIMHGLLNVVMTFPAGELESSPDKIVAAGLILRYRQWGAVANDIGPPRLRFHYLPRIVSLMIIDDNIYITRYNETWTKADDYYFDLSNPHCFVQLDEFIATSLNVNFLD